MIYFEELAKIIGGRIFSIAKNNPIEYLVTDSRKPVVSKASVFFAIKGDRHDGHNYVKELWDLGVEQFVIEQVDDFSWLKDKKANVIQVDNTLTALQQLAESHRKQHTAKVIGITGSNGKTVVKEWLYQLLCSDFDIIRSPKSYNSQLGVALSLWQIQENHQLAIIEAGISKPGEMAKLQSMISPEIGIFTNLGTAHNEGFKSRSEKAKEKAILFKDCETVIYCKDHKEVGQSLQALSKPKSFCWSKSEPADLVLHSIDSNNGKHLLQLEHGGEQFLLTTKFGDEASIENLMHGICYMLISGFGAYEVQQRLSRLTPVKMRLELKEANYGCYLIDDSYNNDIAGLRIAISFLNQQKIRDKKTVILSDILQAGLSESELYQNVNDLLAKKGIDRLIGIGPEISRNKKQFDLPAKYYKDVDQFLADRSLQFNNEVVLIKGARVFEFEKITDLLQRKVHDTVLEISLDALTHNLNFYKSRLNEGTSLMAMVKAFAYGSGSQEIANLLQFHRVNYLAVAYPDEGVALREGGIHLPIMVMNTSQESLAKLVENQLEPEVFSLELLQEIDVFTKDTDSKFRIHLKVDTGMHRLGFNVDELTEAMTIIANNASLEVATVFTHLAAQESEIHDEFTRQQVAKFKSGYEEICKHLDYAPVRHVVNSAGILRYPEYHFEMVRLGIGLYGIESSQNFADSLIPISRLRTSISQIRKIAKGETIGYGRAGKATDDMVLATVPIGYADGYDRGFGKGVGAMLINDQRAPVVGEVCMDMTMLDITNIAAEVGDEVVVFGEDPSISKLAHDIGTIPYEILTKVSERVKRIYISE